MLKALSSYISNLNQLVSFEDYFNSYLMKIQDDSISNEIDLIIQRYSNDVNEIERAVQECHERLVNFK